MYRYLSILFLMVLANFAFGSQSFAQSDVPGACQNTYALCTSAKCVPLPNDPDMTVCSCVVREGWNWGQSSCKLREPIIIRPRKAYLLSTYSFAQAKHKSVMECTGGQRWTDCLDAVCVVSPYDKLKANCFCPYGTGNRMVTYGGDCKAEACENVIWSAATPKAFALGSMLLAKAMGLSKPPATFCPRNKTILE